MLTNSIVRLVADDLPTIAITQDMLKPIVDSVVSNIGIVLVPCIVVFGILLGVKLIPRFFKMFIS